MLKNSNIRLVKVIIDLAIFLEFTSEELLNPDSAIEIMEQMAAELQLLNDDEKQEVVMIFYDLSENYTGDTYEYVKGLPESLGLI
ncbi:MULTISPECIES: hypothetical protein [Photorhabdus]|uniref:Uncharacterized protein n=2 Tax=Photorhabdus asymbiotica TaxID=291112 RepID=A0ABX9STD8_9GAMM|nr:hypothetical protein [Photorhabdus asymbiotica]RKS66777.1 hypothetical protein BDD30_1118 [Photorhabdus asymbiotica]